jgi:hypothetical protein
VDYLLVEGVGCVWLPAFMMAAPTRCSPALRLERSISQLVGGGGDDDGGLAVKVNVDSWRRWRSRWRSCGSMIAQVNTWPRWWPGCLTCRLPGGGWGRWCGSGGCRGPARCACGDDPRRFVAGVQMRCRECAAEVAVTARGVLPVRGSECWAAAASGGRHGGGRHGGRCGQRRRG